LHIRGKGKRVTSFYQLGRLNGKKIEGQLGEALEECRYKTNAQKKETTWRGTTKGERGYSTLHAWDIVRRAAQADMGTARNQPKTSNLRKRKFTKSGNSQ